MTVKNFNPDTGVYEKDNDAVLGLKYFFNNNPSEGYLHIRKYTRLDANDEYSFKPFFVTPDGVKVTGVKERTVYLGNGYYTGGTNEGLHVKDIAAPSEETYYVTVEPQVMMLSLRSTYAIHSDGSDEDPEQLTITKMDGNSETTQKVNVGNHTGMIEYTEKEGYFFGGWYEDEALTIPADFSNVDADMTVYAKYIPVSSVDVVVKRTGKTLNSVNLKTTVKMPTDAVAEVGFIYEFESNTELIIANEKSESYTGSILSIIFGGKRTKVYESSANWSLAGLGSRDTFTVTAYWITEDGTTVYVAPQTYTYFLGMLYEG